MTGVQTCALPIYVNTTNLCGGQFLLSVGGSGFTITDVFELVAPVKIGRASCRERV